MIRHRPWALLALLLTGCGDSGSGSGAAPTETPASLCIETACNQATSVAAVPDAENLLFTPDGRLFVSGGTNVYEVVRTGDTTVELTALSATDCNFTGLAYRRETLYASCASGELYAGSLRGTPALTSIYQYTDTALPNGMATGADGSLYIADGPLPGNGGLPSPKILRLQFDEQNPLQVIEQSTWLEAPLAFPNGLVRLGDTLFVTDGEVIPPALGVVRAIRILADGSAGEVTTIATLDGVLDDLSLAGSDLVVTEFSTGRVVRLAPDGRQLSATDAGGFAFPSSVIVGQAPMFLPGEWLVTEKGLIGDTTSAFGNQLTVLRPLTP